jgi:hypothetical protein
VRPPSSYESSHQTALRALKQQQVRSDHAREKEQVARRKSRKAQERAEGREGKDDACANDEQRRRAEGDAWPAAQRVSRGPNDEDDQGLRGERLDEPTGMKQLLRGAEDFEQRVKGQQTVSLSRRGFSASADPAADVFRVGSHPGRKGTAAIPHGYRPSVITKFAGPQYQGRRPLTRYPYEVR